MHHFVIAFARWVQSTRLGVGILESTWAFPYVQLTHFTGLSLFVGTNLALDLRLMGIGKRSQTAAQLADSLFAWNWVGFAIGITGGFMLFSTAALTYVANPSFDIKLSMLIPAGLVLHIINQQKARTWGQTPETPGIAKLAGFIELLLWLSVVTAAVLIPYFAAEP
ncbi:MAG: hypothetical protein ABSA57_04215 [Candidatus Acidiferrales bacterium]|jgi:hypothetical protein